MYVSAAQVASVLAGMPYPARPWQIVAQAEHNGAAQPVRDALLDIPAGVYTSPGDIANAIHLSSSEATAPRQQGGGDTTYVSAAQVASAVAGMSYPARLWQIVAQAEHNGASQLVRDALVNIADGVYASPGDIANAVHFGLPRSIARGRPCHHKRHPKSCRWQDWHFRSDGLAS